MYYLHNNFMDKEKNKDQKRIYLDFASQTIINNKVSNEIKKAKEFNFNPANLYKEGLYAENLLNEARKKIANVLGVKNYEIYFTNNGTISCATAIIGVVNKYKEKNFKNKNYIKPHIITSNIEHSSVLENIKYLEKINEIEATYINCDENGLISPEFIKKEIKENTILISIMYVNNEIGVIQEIKNISKKIKEYKKENKKGIVDYPYFHTDAAQAPNYISLYIDMLGVDMLSLNGSKICGPKSSAILFKKEYVNISPIYFGGGQERNIFSGTQDIEKAIGIALAIEKAQENSKNEKLLEGIATLRNSLLKNILNNIKEAKLNGYFNENEWKSEKHNIKKEERNPKRVPSNISVWLPDFPSDEMIIRLDKRGFAISAGSACSAKSDEYSHAIFALYKNKMKKNEAEKIARESIRISIDKNTKEEDLNDFVRALKDIYYKFRK